MTKHRILALALAGALAVPQVGLAAEDSTGMRYDSASEGLYGSLRMIYRSKEGNKKDMNGVVESDTSRWGFQGTADMGGGLTGVYRWEQALIGQDGDAPGNVRLHYVGVRGGFGEVQFGSVGNNVYDMAYSYADGSISGGGNYVVGDTRLKRSLAYNTPDLNGFQGGAFMQFQGGSSKAVAEACLTSAGAVIPGTGTNGAVVDGDIAPRQISTSAGNQKVCGTVTNNVVSVSTNSTYRAAVAEANALTRWGIGGKYAVRGFKVGAGYDSTPDAWTVSGSKKDKTVYHLAGQYKQDNWKVAVAYANTNTSDNTLYDHDSDSSTAMVKREDETRIGFLGSIDVGKVGLRLTHDIVNDVDGDKRNDDSYTSFGGEYRFTAQTKVYGAYIARDLDSDSNTEDSVVIGMRVDF